jgi:hypothetical protein
MAVIRPIDPVIPNPPPPLPAVPVRPRTATTAASGLSVHFPADLERLSSTGTPEVRPIRPVNLQA